MEVEIKYGDKWKGVPKVIAFYHVISSYFTMFLLQGVNINRCQSGLFYLTPSLMYHSVACLLVKVHQFFALQTLCKATCKTLITENIEEYLVNYRKYIPATWEKVSTHSPIGCEEVAYDRHSGGTYMTNLIHLLTSNHTAVDMVDLDWLDRPGTLQPTIILCVLFIYSAYSR